MVKRLGLKIQDPSGEHYWFESSMPYFVKAKEETMVVLVFSLPK